MVDKTSAIGKERKKQQRKVDAELFAKKSLFLQSDAVVQGRQRKGKEVQDQKQADG